MKLALITLIVAIGIVGTAVAMGSMNYDLSWNTISGGGGASSSPSYKLDGSIGGIPGEASSTNYRLSSGFWYTESGSAPTIITVTGGTAQPNDLNTDGKYEDVNGNHRADFADVVLYFNQMSWIAANEPLAAFDYNGNGRIDFADVVWLFNNI